MKNSLIKAMTLCCTVAAFWACNKDNASVVGSDGTAVLENNSIERLRVFRKQIERVRANPDEKSSETISLEEALWDVENHFNLTYSDVECYYDQIIEHEFTLSLPVDDQQQVLVYDAVMLYEEVVNKTRSAIESDEFENKGFISLNIKEVNQNVRGTTITFSGKTGNRNNYNPPVNHVNGPFDVGDDWMFASPLGKCDDPDIPSGADKLFQENLYVELIEPFVATENGYRNIYLDRRSFVFDGSNYSSIYYEQNPDHFCISHEYMNDYYHGEKQVISNIIPAQYQLAGYSPISIEITGVLVEDGMTATHYNEIEYGIRMRVPIDEFGSVESLVP